MSEIKLPIQMYDPSRDYKLHKKELDNAVLSIIQDGNFINGKPVKDLESVLQNYVNCERAITCGNGTDALYIALKALNIGLHDEVITVALSWISSVETISMTGATPVFVDVKKETFCIDESLIEKAITKNTKAILVVSLYGHMPDYKAIYSIADKYGLYLIEDGAQSFGAERDNYKSCSCKYTDIATTSFFPTKPLGCFGDGGCIFTNNKDLGDKLYAIKNHGSFERFKHKYIGLNSRLDTMQANVLLEKMKYLDESLLERNNVATQYSIGLKDICVVPKNNMTIHAFAQYSILFKSKEIRDKVFTMLKDNGVNVAIFYSVPLYKQECFNNINHDMLNNTEFICDRILNLPCYSHVTHDEINYIINLLKNNLA
jgi:UDP-2-acetamido-2-deoxy-ribo-hexuluronate aminotransferase